MPALCENCARKNRKMTDKTTGRVYYTCGSSGAWSSLNRTYAEDVQIKCPHDEFIPKDPNGQLEVRPKPDGYRIARVCEGC